LDVGKLPNKVVVVATTLVVVITVETALVVVVLVLATKVVALLHETRKNDKTHKTNNLFTITSFYFNVLTLSP
jgi:hypothetical protein